MRENEEAPFKQPAAAVCAKQAVILQPPASQAGCRGFEPRLPLLRIDRLCAGRSEAAWWQPGSDTASKEAVFLCAQVRAATPCLDFACALLHEKSYPRVGFFPIFFPRMGDPHHHCPLLSRSFLATGKVLLFVIGRVRFLVKPRCFATRLSACVAGGTTCTSDLLRARIWATGAQSERKHYCAPAR